MQKLWLRYNQIQKRRSLPVHKFANVMANIQTNAKLINVLNGFNPRIGIKISNNTEISNIIGVGRLVHCINMLFFIVDYIVKLTLTIFMININILILTIVINIRY